MKTIIIKEEGKDDLVYEDVGQFALIAQSLGETPTDHKVYSGSYDYLIGQVNFLYQTLLEAWRKQNG